MRNECENECDRQTDRQTGRQTDRQTDRQTKQDRQLKSCWLIFCVGRSPWTAIHSATPAQLSSSIFPKFPYLSTMGSSDDVNKRTPERVGSNAPPPAVKAKGAAPAEETAMQMLIRMVKDIKKETSKLDTLESCIADMKGELNSKLSAFEERLKKVEASQAAEQAKYDSFQDSLADITTRIAQVESSRSSPPTSSSHTWAPPPQSAPSSNSTFPARKASPDELVITGFPRDTHMKIREKVSIKFLEKLQVSGKYFKVLPKFLHGQICFLTKTPSAPQAVISQAVEEFRALNDKKPISITVDDVT